MMESKYEFKFPSVLHDLIESMKNRDEQRFDLQELGTISLALASIIQNCLEEYYGRDISRQELREYINQIPTWIFNNRGEI